MNNQTSGDSALQIMRTVPSLTIVVPCYNEAEVFIYCVDALNKIVTDLVLRKKIEKNSRILFVDDGSKDNTWLQITEAAKKLDYVQGLKLSRNRGHQTALIAGLSVVDTDVCISIDADLQDDIKCIEQMIDKYMLGNDIVYGVRNDRSKDSFFKRNTANIFYGSMSAMGVNQIENHADYRLLSKRALAALLEFKEQNLYIRGLIPLLGFNSDKVFYTREERVAGESKYPLKKMLGLAIEGVTSLTVTPLRLICALGFLTCFFSFLAIIYILVAKFTGQVIEGWTSVIISIFFLSGVQLLSLGVIGEYVGKIYLETKQRPKFFIDEQTTD
ncbi:Glycosyltransferase involved in cell wall bisynthesis (WcaA) (PDB:5MLZ) [Commensalibacter communis]|uniref:Glycosyltransferase involved in cell wall bisynthesis (WcaA) n=1 Tax=Commensalibacter communis TaxID=2972786 RepID=A0A9W4TKH0_9PROT|nr:glycosyltransferase family 2 protein [Commensalibacter communis]CAI3924170.1 Glycosyltransferase involved in cell wall bisynthesis (WcaA) (PDB:5MLZ) [Commensalibacter communis]CAI3929220.1 Glycosyltransferase involved in cell wall bisynthesis (WcaA) (PDB:5MLZ) [Commensalibacter communis]CAI3930706.1 Glycosyltransferase involved in cell wall bisynthesis (WcaA) (PDB:5MLZ) [Commensalibacter communis]CAI3931770.1 Glycosyltransferase involved in cell wall bisynthesis (WcaA) (PDB:5MLZ) [Commensali